MKYASNASLGGKAEFVELQMPKALETSMPQYLRLNQAVAMFD